jgi:hypothetical protein
MQILIGGQIAAESTKGSPTMHLFSYGFGGKLRQLLLLRSGFSL